MFNLEEMSKLYEENIKEPTKDEAIDILSKEDLSDVDFIKLLNCDDLDVLEMAAREARRITEAYFGKNIFLYIPLYISNYCSSGCIYCGYSCLNKIERRRLSLDEVEEEMRAIKKKGFNSILLLTGEDDTKEGFEYLKSALKIAKRFFPEILIETGPLTFEGYRELVEEGLVGVTLYQETYDLNTYEAVHLIGRKRDFYRRLNAIEEAIRSGVREINIGCLLGLSTDFKRDVFLTIMHGKYLLKKYPKIELSISFPRIRPFEGMNFCYTKVDDLQFVKFIVYTRLLLKNIGINISTREGKELRDNLIGLGVTKMSAESRTGVGGYARDNPSPKQFEISDDRTVDEILLSIKSKGYNAEFTNWVMI
ncbi:MAG: 2-iminoacetate synthase ThiH [Caloramator sp.]|nr:2-iminoacetate synthase ThiH [Caloramator sp.]